MRSVVNVIESELVVVRFHYLSVADPDSHPMTTRQFGYLEPESNWLDWAIN
jgi:hypothetical protein